MFSSSMPALCPISVTALCRSPLTNSTVMPDSRKNWTVDFASGRSVSFSSNTAANRLFAPSSIKPTTVAAPSTSTLVGKEDPTLFSHAFKEPMKKGRSLTIALTPSPGMLSSEVTVTASSPLSFASLIIADATGWERPLSNAAASWSACCSVHTPFDTRIDFTSSIPEVRVPVLSKTMVLMFCARCSASPPLYSTPNLAPTPVPTMTAVGVAKPSAHGHATTNVEMANTSANTNPPYGAVQLEGSAPNIERRSQNARSNAAIATTAGMKTDTTRSATF
mmetsp:Transcript_49854/g.128276  ORF Transcript_49854/g.128276 Transcript_49854/m.128276 type:complete len:278 (+) Transcript_49854:1586-2419(+)